MSMIDNFNDHTYVGEEYWDYMRQIEKAMSGDLVLVVSPATVGSSAAKVAAAIAGDDQKFTRRVKVTLEDATGNLHTWFNGSFAVAVTETSTSGTAALDEGVEYVNLVDGVGYVNVNYDGTWVATEKSTLTVTGATILGKTTGNKTSVDTLVA